MFEFLLDPLIDTYYFGCPDSCVVPNGNVHELLKILFTPLVVLGVSIGVTFATLFALGRLPNLETLRSFRPRLRSKSVTQAIMDSPEAVVTEHKEPSLDQLEKNLSRQWKKEVSKVAKNITPDDAFAKFISSQDPDHPQTEILKTARTEAKEEEIVTPEMKMIGEISENERLDLMSENETENKKQLEEHARAVNELMKTENITEDEAVNRILDKIEEEEEPEVDMEVDVFKQDIVVKEKKGLAKFFAKNTKKTDKPRYHFNLTKLGSQRRNEYAKQIETTLKDWVFPMPKYAGKNQELQIPDELIKSELKKLSLFISMGELMADKTKSKKRYWEKIKVA